MLNADIRLPETTDQNMYGTVSDRNSVTYLNISFFIFYLYEKKILNIHNIMTANVV